MPDGSRSARRLHRFDSGKGFDGTKEDCLSPPHWSRHHIETDNSMDSIDVGPTRTAEHDTGPLRDSSVGVRCGIVLPVRFRFDNPSAPETPVQMAHEVGSEKSTSGGERRPQLERIVDVLWQENSLWSNSDRLAGFPEQANSATMVLWEEGTQLSSVFEISPSGRAKCRGCEKPIAKGDVRFGERMENPYGEGLMSLWFHPLCAALKRPEAFLAGLAEPTLPDQIAVEDAEELKSLAAEGIAHPRLQRISGVERASSGRARCRACKELIEKENWRLKLTYYQDGRFAPSGYIHVGCSLDYLETVDFLPRLTRLSELSST